MNVRGADLRRDPNFEHNQEWELCLDAEPPKLEDFRFEKQGPLWFGTTEDGWVRFFAQTANREGYGGAHFDIMTRVGGLVTLVGPWSSWPSVMLAAGFPPCIPVIVDRYTRAHLLVPVAQEILDRFNLASQYEITNGRRERWLPDEESYWIRRR